MADAGVELRGVGHVFGAGDRRVEALGPVDLAIDPRELVCIVGPSGCGKTTLLHLLAGFQAPTEGVLEVGGVPVDGPSPARGVVFQQPNLYPWLTVRGNVGFGLRMRRVPRARRREEVDRWLGVVGLDGFGDHRPYELSGGMQQRCQIARVLANDPALILMDEPFGALDALTRERMQLELLRIWGEEHRTVVFITHSVDEAVLLGTRVLVMSPRPGRIVFDEPSPFGPEVTRGADLRLHPDFVPFRERIAAAIST
ncbi:MAG TPA: ABC transporter ATP-binding protein [Iamia sp.]|nr:ABC transporter ATP-binding protein [Iamia sp.]